MIFFFQVGEVNKYYVSLESLWIIYYDMKVWERGRCMAKYDNSWQSQAGAELCQAQDKLGLVKPSVADKKLSLATSKHLGPFHFIK